jgi:hypothetical protein
MDKTELSCFEFPNAEVCLSSEVLESHARALTRFQVTYF